MESPSTTQITLAPARLSLRSDQTDVPVSSWGRINDVTSQQVYIHRSPYILTCLDASSSEILGRYLYEIDSSEPKLLAEDDFAPEDARQSTLFFHGWLLTVSDEHAPTYFRSLAEFMAHAQRVADSTGNSFALTVLDKAPEGQDVLEFTPALAAEEQTENDTFESRLASAPVLTEEFEPVIVQAAPIEAPETDTAEEATVSNETVETAEPEHEPGQVAIAPDMLTEAVQDLDEPTEEPFGNTDEEVEEEAESGLIRYTPLDEMFTVQDEDEEDEDAAPRFNRRRLLTITGIVLGASILSGGALAGYSYYQATSESEGPATTALSQTRLDVPAGYLQQPAWTLPIPDGARVHASQAATVIIDRQTLTIFSNSTGKELRAVTSEWEVATIDETIIDGNPAIVWFNADKTKLTAWYTTDAASEGTLITADIPSGSKVTRPSAEIMVKDRQGRIYRLTHEGLKQYKAPEGLTPWAFSDTGLISIGYDVPVEVSDAEGTQVSATTLLAPETGYTMLQWISASNGYAASIWAQDLNNVTDQTPVKLVIHSLETGQSTEVIDTPYQDVEPAENVRDWKIGQGSDLATYGDFIFSLRTGTLQTSLPNGTTALQAKGTIGLAEASNGATYIFQGTEPGYSLANKVILAQTSSLLIAQSANRVVAYPATLS